MKVKRKDGEEKEIDEVELFRELIVNLIEKGNKIEFNSQAIANTLNALSKWDVFGNKWDSDQQEKFKDLIVKLAEKGEGISEQFNSQDIANTYDALYKFDILEKWAENEQNNFKALIVKLAEKGKGIYEEFSSQEIANTFNAFSKLGILDDSKWTSEEQKELKSLIVQLAKRGGSIEGYNLKDIAKIYSALLEWSSGQWNLDEFKSLTDKLEEQVQAIAQEKNKGDNVLDNIRFTSQIITDLPKLKLKKLITDDKELLIHLMQCLSTSIDKSEDSDLNERLPKENVLSGLSGFTDVIKGLEDKSSLKGKFDDNLIEILNKLSKVQLDRSNIEKIQSKVKDVIKSGVIEKEDSLNNALDKLSPEQNGQLSEKAVNEPQTYLNDPTVDKQLQGSCHTISC